MKRDLTGRPRWAVDWSSLAAWWNRHRQPETRRLPATRFAAGSGIAPERIESLLTRETERFVAERPRSMAQLERARATMLRGGDLLRRAEPQVGLQPDLTVGKSIAAGFHSRPTARPTRSLAY